MIRSLLAVIVVSSIGLLVLFLFSAEKTSSYNSYAISQIVSYPKETVLIYAATPYFGSKMSIDIGQGCSPETAKWCLYTTDRNESERADAWLYHNRDFSPRMMDNLTRRYDQVHVMYTMESPVHETIRFKPDEINWTMTYRRDSEIFKPYGMLQMTMFKTEQNNDSIWDMKQPDVTAAWMVSNCKTGNKRMELIKKAQKLGLDVHIYGSCSKLKVPGCGRYDTGWNECPTQYLRKYYFYFSFENSNCVDYVTEKFYKALGLFYAVPIVIKREIYTNMGFPPKSFIALDDFNSISEMNAFLNKLKNNKTEYLSYHAWRNDYIVTDKGGDWMGVCELCRRLRRSTLEHKSYHNLGDWFNSGMCDNAYAFKYLK